MKRVSKSGCFNGNRRLCRNLRKVETGTGGKRVVVWIGRKQVERKRKKEKEEWKRLMNERNGMDYGMEWNDNGYICRLRVFFLVQWFFCTVYVWSGTVTLLLDHILFYFIFPFPTTITASFNLLFISQVLKKNV